MAIFKSLMNEYMTKWLTNGVYNKSHSDTVEHMYIEYACNKNYIHVKFRDREENYHLELAPQGRAWLDEQRRMFYPHI